MPKDSSKLFWLKLLHSIVWLFFASNVIFVFLAGILGIDSLFVYISIFLVLIEGIILLIFKWRCPITIVAQKYTKNPEVGFDIFLPKLIAKYNKTIFTTIFIIGLILIFLRKAKFFY
jgi:hypothetical protein